MMRSTYSPVSTNNNEANIPCCGPKFFSRVSCERRPSPLCILDSSTVNFALFFFLSAAITGVTYGIGNIKGNSTFCASDQCQDIMAKLTIVFASCMTAFLLLEGFLKAYSLYQCSAKVAEPENARELEEGVGLKN